MHTGTTMLIINPDREIQYFDNKTITFGCQVNSFGTPLLRIEFLELPSWNDILSVARSRNLRTPSQAETMIAKYRKKGFEKAIFQGERQGWQINRWTEFAISDKGKELTIEHARFKQPIYPGRLECILRYWRPTWANYDSFSPISKPVVDGFRDAGVFEDDNFKVIPEVRVMFCGIDKTLVLSDTAKEERRDKRAGRKNQRMPTQARFWFDFYGT
jgi:hypothetical protein